MAELDNDPNLQAAIAQNAADVELLYQNPELMQASRNPVRRGANGVPEPLLQPLINASHANILRQIQQINPNFTIVRGTGRIRRAEVARLEGVLASLRGSTSNSLTTHFTQYPPNGGFSGAPVNAFLNAGMRIDRYGNTSGTYVSPAGTPFGARGLPPSAQNSTFTTYQVLRPIPVQIGIAAPAFQGRGGGVQIRFERSVRSLLETGHIGVVR